MLVMARLKTRWWSSQVMDLPAVVGRSRHVDAILLLGYREKE